MQPHGGQQIIAEIEAVDGDWNPSRIVVVAFSSVDAAKAWYNFPAYQEVLPTRSAYTDDKTMLVEAL